MLNSIFNFLTQPQFCGYALLDTHDTIAKLSETVNDITVLISHHIVESNDLINLYDPVNDSLSPFTKYTGLKSSDNVIAIAQKPGETVQGSFDTVCEGIKYMFDFTDEEIEELGIFGCLKIARECNHLSLTILESLLSSTYLQGGADSSTLIGLLDEIDVKNPTISYSWHNVYNFSDPLIGLATLVANGDYVLPGISPFDIRSCSSIEELLGKMGMTEQDLVEALVLQQHSGSPCTTLLQCINMQYSKGYEIQTSTPTTFYIYKMNGDEGCFRMPIDDTVLDAFTSILHLLTEESAGQGVIEKALTLAAEGETRVSDIAAFLGQGFDSSYKSAQYLISTFSSFGSSYNLSTATAVAGLYKSMTNSAVKNNSTIEWGALDVPSLDTGIGSVIVGVAQTALQATGTILLVAGGAVAKLAGAVLYAGGLLWQKITQTVADAADTFPDIESGTTDRLLGYPLYQNDNVSLSWLPANIVASLKEQNSVKLFFPWGLIFLYNVNANSNICACKVFASIGICNRYNHNYGNYYFGTISHGHRQFFSPRAFGVRWWEPQQVVTIERFSFDSDAIMLELKEMLGLKKGTASLDFTGVPTDPAVFDVGSKDSADYMHLWTSIILNATMMVMMTSYGQWDSLLSTGEKFYFDLSAGQIKAGIDNPDVGVAGFAKGTFFAACAYLFGYWTMNQENENLLQVKHPTTVVFGDPTGNGIDSFVMNEYLPWCAERISENMPYLLNVGAWSGLPCVILPFSFTDKVYAVTLPKRRLASLIFAAIVTIAITMVLMISFTIFKKIISLKLQAKNYLKLQSLQAEREQLASLETHSKQDEIAKLELTKELFKKTRRFNLVSGLLGMGTYNMMADWYEGSGVIGSTWALRENSGSIESLSDQLSSISAKTTEVSADPNDAETSISLYDVTKLINGK